MRRLGIRRRLINALQFAIEKENLHGPVNFVSPDPVTNRVFTKTLAKVLDRPALFPVPAFVLKMLPGHMAEEAILASQRCQPARLIQNGFKFDYADLEQALRHLLAGAI